jgi:hypothetical protein
MERENFIFTQIAKMTLDLGHLIHNLSAVCDLRVEIRVCWIVDKFGKISNQRSTCMWYERTKFLVFIFMLKLVNLKHKNVRYDVVFIPSLDITLPSWIT